ncbi:MAG: hypothetical protein RLZZ94_160 [Bacteroidota bacterium]
MKTTLKLLIAFLPFSFSCLAGNEPLLKGQGQLDFKYQFTKFNSVFDNDGELKPIPEIRYSSINLNARFGITDKIAGSIYAPVFNTASNAESSDLKVTEAKSKSGIGDISIGINYALAKQNRIQPVISVYQNLGTGKNDSSGLNTGFGDFANSIYFDLFYEVNSNWMINGNIGYQNRKKNFKNDFLGNIYLNYNKPEKYAFSIFMKGKLPFSELSNEENIVNYGLYKNSEGFLRYGAMGSICFRKNMSLTVNYENYLKGQFIGNGAIYSAGIQINLTKNESAEANSKE